MKDINADEAREIANNYEGKELSRVLLAIKSEAEKGHTSYCSYGRLNKKTIADLQKRGFKVEEFEPSLSKGNAYIIKW